MKSVAAGRSLQNDCARKSVGFTEGAGHQSFPVGRRRWYRCLGTVHSLGGAALDNLGDAGVYGVSLYAEGRSARHKARAARISGWLLIGFSLMLAVEVLRRFFLGLSPSELR